MTDLMYVIIASDPYNEGEIKSWVHCICRENLTAEETCATLNKQDALSTYHIEEHEVY